MMEGNRDQQALPSKWRWTLHVLDTILQWTVILMIIATVG
jgi:hypothetical protein